jgi:hypothetical protein
MKLRGFGEAWIWMVSSNRLSYSGGRDRRIASSKPGLENIVSRICLKHKIKILRIGVVT